MKVLRITGELKKFQTYIVVNFHCRFVESTLFAEVIKNIFHLSVILGQHKVLVSSNTCMKKNSAIDWESA